MRRRLDYALAVSLLAHGLALSATVFLMERDRPIPAPPDTTVVLIYEQPAPSADAAPAEASPTVAEPQPAVEPPAPSEASQAEVPLAAREPVPAAEPPAEAASPTAPSADDAEAPKLSAAWLPLPRATTSHPTARQTSPAITASARPSSSAGDPVSAQPAPLLPAHPVAGMQTTRPPAYPEVARRRGEQGRVLLQVAVSADGLPASVAVTESSGSPRLDAAAREAVERWRFVPATRGGVPVAATAEVPIRFLLKD